MLNSTRQIDPRLLIRENGDELYQILPRRNCEAVDCLPPCVTKPESLGLRQQCGKQNQDFAFHYRLVTYSYYSLRDKDGFSPCKM